MWDVIDNNQAVQIVHTHLTSRCVTTIKQNVLAKYALSRTSDWDPSEAAHTLCMSARRRWESLSPMIDDITALVIDLQKVTGQNRLR